MKKTLLVLFALVVSMYAIGQKFQAVSAGMNDVGTPAVFQPATTAGQGLSVVNPETDYMGAWVIPGIGTNSGNTRIPGNTWKFQRTEYIITPAEMLASGFPVGAEVNSIGWLIATAGGTTQTGTLNVWLMNTNDVTYTLGANWTIAGFTQVHSASFTVPITVGAYEVPFTGGAPFVYTGGGVYVAWEFSNPGTAGTTALVANCNSSLSSSLYGARDNTALPTALGAASAFRPATLFGNNFYTDILSMGSIWTLEKAPIPFGSPVPVSVRVLNNSTSPATFNVTLTIKDATNTTTRHTATQTVTALAANSETVVTYSWVPTIQENIKITAEAAAAPGENFIVNNILTIDGNVNANLFGNIFNMTNPPGAVGWTSPTYAATFANRFEMITPGVVTGANLAIGNSATCTGQTISAVVHNKNGAVVAQSAPYVILATDLGQVVNFTFPTPPNIAPEEFYVGLATTPSINAAAYYPMGYWGETPTRPNAFYRFELAGSPPVAIDGYKFGIEAQVAPFTGVVYPRNFTAASGGVSQIDLSWLLNPSGNPVIVAVNSTNTFGTPVNGTAYPVSSAIPGGGTVIYSGGASAFSHTGLTPGTTYYYTAWSVDGSTTYSTGVTALEATYYPVPYTQDFEAPGLLPTSWTGTMAIEDLHGTASSRGITFNLFPGAGYYNCNAVSPHIVIPANTCKLTFDYRLTNWDAAIYPFTAKVMTAGDQIDVQASTNHGATWTTLHTINMGNHVTSVDFANVSVVLTGYTGQTMLRFYCTWGSGDYYVDIDNFIVEELPLCPPPTAVNATGITLTSAIIGWTGPSVAILDYGPTGHAAGTGTIINPVTSNPYTLNGLTSGAGYDVYVRQECSAGVFSSWAGPASFTTLEILQVTPKPFNFGNVAMGVPSASQVFTIKNNGAGAILMDGVAIQGTDAAMFALTDGTVYPYNLAAGASYTVSVIFTPTSTGPKTASLVVSENETGHPVALSGTGTCPTPSALTAAGSTATSAILGWTAPGTSSWEIEYGPAGFTQGTGTMITAGVTNPYTLTGLTANTWYSYYVRTVCGAGVYSAWAGPVAFTSLCGVTMAPFTEPFETVPPVFPPACWSRTTGTAAWSLTSSASGYGIGAYTSFAYFYNFPGGSTFDLMTFTFDASAVLLPQLTFDYAYATYIDEVDQLDVYYSTDGGTTYTLLENMPGGLTGILNTGGATSSVFIPTAGQWATHHILLPAGTNKIKFTGTSAYGNNLYVDNVKVETSVPEFLAVTGQVGTGVSNCYNATNTITVGGTAPFTVAAGGSAIFIATQKISFLPGTTVMLGGYMHGYISSIYCGSAPLAPVAAGAPENSMVNYTNAYFTLYPNPTNGNFTLVQKGENAFGNVKVEIYNMQGGRVLSTQMIGEKQHEFESSELPTGLYFVKLVAEDYTETIKLIKTR